jgi:hypothetical protein
MAASLPVGHQHGALSQLAVVRLFKNFVDA